MNEFRSPAIQAMNLIRHIGDQVSESGEPIGKFSGGQIQDVIGAPSAVFAEQLVEDLGGRRRAKRFTCRLSQRSHVTPTSPGSTASCAAPASHRRWRSPLSCASSCCLPTR